MRRRQLRKFSSQAKGFSLIEVIIVVALIAFVYTVAIPQFSLRTGAEAANKVNQLSSDIRNAYDLSVLSGKSYRMVLYFATGEYWLEEPDRAEIFLGDAKLDRDPTDQEEKDQAASFEDEFKEYEDLAGEIVKDSEKGDEIPPTSPVVEAKDKLNKPKWAPVDSPEWGKRTMGGSLMFKDMQAEHHGHKQEIGDLGQEARGFIYFFPNGYVERAVIHVVYKTSDGVPDDTQEPYTVTTNPWEGTADVVSGYVEVDVHEDKQP